VNWTCESCRERAEQPPNRETLRITEGTVNMARQNNSEPAQGSDRTQPRWPRYSAGIVERDSLEWRKPPVGLEIGHSGAKLR